MNRIRTKDIFESAGIVAIVASLVFLGLQVRQDQEIARAELGAAGTVARSAEILTLKTEPDFAKVWTKMHRQPEELTIEEAVRIDSFLQIAKESFLRECLLVEAGIFGECENYVRTHVPMYFGSRYAKAWWKKKDTGPVLEWVDQVIQETEPGSELREIEDRISDM